MFRTLLIIITVSAATISCSGKKESGQMKTSAIPIGERIFYEIFVHAFYDSNGDGIGDLNGVTSRLDYLQDLGVNGIWLLPVHPSPTYHKYDVIDYYGIHSDYGTMEDMKTLLAEARKRDIIVLVDMVINHTSSLHHYFTESRKSEKNPYRDFYVWSSDSLVHNENPHQWHVNGNDKEKYYGFFWKDMPDLNFDNPGVRKEMKKIGEYWLTEVGVDGFRLDAIKFIYPDSLSEKNVSWWQEYRFYLESTGEPFFLVAEIWDESSFIAPFLNNGVHAAFNLELSFAIEEMLTTRKDSGLARILGEIHRRYRAVSDSYQDAIFVKNHDQDRIMSLLDDPRQARLAATILFTLPGIPFVYYGEEIAMLGKKPDEHIREPMVWDLPGQDPGQTRWIEPIYSTPERIVPVKQQLADSASLLSHYKRMIFLRKEHTILSSGEIRPMDRVPENFCAYALEHDEKEILVIHNLTGKTGELDGRLLKAGGQILHLDGLITEPGKLRLDPFGTLIRYRE